MLLRACPQVVRIFSICKDFSERGERYTEMSIAVYAHNNMLENLFYKDHDINSLSTHAHTHADN